VGRVIYLRAYVSDPSTRSLGYALSALPVLVLIVMALFGIVRVLADQLTAGSSRQRVGASGG